MRVRTHVLESLQRLRALGLAVDRRVERVVREDEADRDEVDALVGLKGAETRQTGPLDPASRLAFPHL